MYEVRPFDKFICLDASLTGLCGSFENFLYMVKIPTVFYGCSTVHHEMVYLVVALQIWGKFCENKRIKIKCDNRAVVDVLQPGSAGDQILATYARNVCF